MPRSISTTDLPAQKALPVFSVVAVHDGFSSSVNVRETLEKAERALGTGLQIKFSSWNFQKLAQPPWGAMSGRLATEAHMIIVVIPGAMPLPDYIIRWLGSCLRQQKHDRAVLVAFHDGEANAGITLGPGFDQLSCLASLWKTEFLSGEDFDRRFNLEFALRIISEKNAVASSSRQRRIDLGPGLQCGGINE